MSEKLYDTPERLEEIRRKVVDVIENCPSVEVVNDRTKIATALGAKLLKGEISEAEFQEASHSLPILPGRVTFDLLTDFIDAVHIAGEIMGIPPEVMRNKMIAHENDHKAVAESFGYESGYILQFSKSASTIYVQPSIWHGTPQGMSDEERNKITRLIVNGPQDLSQHDKEMLN
jgi:hypothetical protein